MLTVQIFNEITGSHFAANEANKSLLYRIPDAAEADVREYMASPGYAIRPSHGYHVLREFCSWYRHEHGVPKRAKKAEGVKPNKADTRNGAREGAPDKAGNGPKKPADEKPVEHEAVRKALAQLAEGIPVYLYGPAGSGKSYLAKQMAAKLGLDYYFTNKVEMTTELTGYTDANGRFVETEFYRALTRGGVFFFDEIDGSDPGAVLVVNGVLADGCATFPGIGKVEAHPDFKVIAAGNTVGLGADGQYVARNVLDGSTLDRFAVIPVNYDKKIEEKLADGSKDIVDFVRALRDAAKHCGIDLIVSYRLIKNLKAMERHPEITTGESVEMYVTARLGEDDIQNLRTDAKMTRLITSGNKYAEAL